MKCIECASVIPVARIKALPDTRTCIACSKLAKVAGFPIISGKTTYSELQIVSQDLAEEAYQKQNRKGSISEGVKFKNLPVPKLSNFE